MADPETQQKNIKEVEGKAGAEVGEEVGDSEGTLGGGSPASDRVDAYANGDQDIDVDNVVSPRFENTYKTTGGGKKSSKKGKKSSKKGKRSCKKCACTEGCGCGCTAKKCVCKGKCKCNKKGGAKKSGKKSGKKGAKKSSKKGAKKSKKSKKTGKRRAKKSAKKQQKGAGSDWISTVYSRGPVNTESNLERDALFTSPGNLVSNEELRDEGNKSTMYV